jgi:diguanylate cyclase (GGDEF)-like protein/PAS domain S-box-containing protein
VSGADDQIVIAPDAERDTEQRDLAAWYRAAIDLGGDSFTVLRAVRSDDRIVDWRILDANALVRARWAASVGSVVGRLQSDLDAFSDNSGFGELYEAALTAGHIIEDERELHLPGGAGGWRSVRVVPIDPDTVAVTTRDVSERVRAERALESERTRFRAMVEHVSDIVVMTDASTTVTWVSESVERLIGYAPATLVGRSAFELIHADDIERVSERFARALAEQPREPQPIELRVVCADGAVRWFEAVGRNRLDDPDLRGLIVHMRDITEQRETAARLRDSEARNRSILETAVDGIVTVNSRGIVDGFNRGAERIFGWSAEEIVGRSYEVLLAPDDLVKLRRGLSGELPSGHFQNFGLRKDGSRFPAQMSLSTVEVGGERLFTTIVRDVSEERMNEARLRLMALNDPLTGLPNRREMTARIDDALARAANGGSKVAVLYLDLDRFKLINDTLGHQVGDELLVLAAARIGRLLRVHDAVGRLGGDEFVVLCEHLLSPTDAVEIAQRVCSALAHPFELAGHSLFVSGSVGIAIWDGGPERAADLLRQADTAMYRAKEEGRGRIALFDHAMHASVSERLEQESALRQALERAELLVFYQPVVEFDTGRIDKFEALVRWERPGHGLVRPAAFVPIAEESGLICELGDFVLGTAARDCARWQAVAPGVGVTVNVSAHQFVRADLAEGILTTLAAAGLDPGLLTVEITESAMSRSPQLVLAALERLRCAGVRIALDDFGTGYSSLTQLRTLPIDALKIDKSFVDTLSDGTGDSSIVQAIIDLGRARGLDIVAEGVETHAIARRLRLLGCEQGQGYVYSRPVPISQALQLFAAPRSATGAG